MSRKRDNNTGRHRVSKDRPHTAAAPVHLRAYKPSPGLAASHAARFEEFEIELELRQKALCELHARLEKARATLDADPTNAYYEILLLADSVSKSPVDYRFFPTLEWRDFCFKTNGAIRQLNQWCELYLDPRHREAAIESYRSVKMLETRAIQELKASSEIRISSNPTLIQQARKVVDLVKAGLNLF